MATKVKKAIKSPKKKTVTKKIKAEKEKSKTGFFLMEPKIKAKWLKALRSGKYNQGTGQLVVKDKDNGSKSFCCLGVLCEVTGGKYQGHAGYLSNKMAAATNLGHYEQDQLAAMNDAKKQPFKQIANWIERNI